jgi:hypothetical protein
VDGKVLDELTREDKDSSKDAKVANSVGQPGDMRSGRENASAVKD